jgi:hypothetical protein
MNQNNSEASIIWLLLGAVAIWYFVFRDGECEEYASKQSCEFVEDQADYDVYYWIDFDDEKTERFIGSVVGLAACEATAIRYAGSINQPWNNRRYICILKKDGKYMEKHRYLRVLPN